MTAEGPRSYGSSQVSGCSGEGVEIHDGNLILFEGSAGHMSRSIDIIQLSRLRRRDRNEGAALQGRVQGSKASMVAVKQNADMQAEELSELAREASDAY